MSNFQYQALLEAIDNFHKKHNPCRFAEGKCLRQRVTGGGPTCCPHSCNNLSDSGCTTRNIFCKLYFCEFAMGTMRWETIREYSSLNKALESIHNKNAGKAYYEDEEFILSNHYLNLSK